MDERIIRGVINTETGEQIRLVQSDVNNFFVEIKRNYHESTPVNESTVDFFTAVNYYVNLLIDKDITHRTYVIKNPKITVYPMVYINTSREGFDLASFLFDETYRGYSNERLKYDVFNYKEGEQVSISRTEERIICHLCDGTELKLSPRVEEQFLLFPPGTEIQAVYNKDGIFYITDMEKLENFDLSNRIFSARRLILTKSITKIVRNLTGKDFTMAEMSAVFPNIKIIPKIKREDVSKIYNSGKSDGLILMDKNFKLGSKSISTEEAYVIDKRKRICLVVINDGVNEPSFYVYDDLGFLSKEKTFVSGISIPTNVTLPKGESVVFIEYSHVTFLPGGRLFLAESRFLGIVDDDISVCGISNVKYEKIGVIE